MAKSESETLKQGHSDISAIDDCRAELRTEINNLETKISKISQDIEQAERKKNKAKDEYHWHFDAGDEAGMKSALAAIRKANNQRESLIASLKEFGEKIMELRSSRDDLMRRGHACKEMAEKKLEACRLQFRGGGFVLRKSQRNPCRDKCFRRANTKISENLTPDSTKKVFVSTPDSCAGNL